MPEELRRDNLTDAIDSARGVLFLMAEMLARQPAPDSLHNSQIARSAVATLCRETSYQLHGAQDDAGF